MSAGSHKEDNFPNAHSPDLLTATWIAMGLLVLSLFVYPFFANHLSESRRQRAASRGPFTFVDLVTFRDLNRTDLRWTDVLRAVCSPYRDLYCSWTRRGSTSAAGLSDQGAIIGFLRFLYVPTLLIGVFAIVRKERLFLLPVRFATIAPYELAKRPPLLLRMRKCWLALIPTGLLILNAAGAMPIPLVGIYYLLLLHVAGLLAFNAYVIDKYNAICNEQAAEGVSYSLDSLRRWFSGDSPLWRTPEAKLNSYVLFGGGVGAFLAQQVLQHKVSLRKSQFQRVFNQCLLIHCILIGAVYWIVELASLVQFC